MSKRIVDITASLAGLIVMAPLLLVLTLWIKLDSPGPVFFRQVRVGKGGQLFRIFKFRTMTVNQSPDAAQITVGGDARITQAGAFLRRTKLDELPQLFNVLKGEMSLVGPRPEVPKYVEYYSPENRRVVLSVRPGITDLASIAFRHENDILAKEPDPERAYIHKILPRKLRYCRFYVQKQSLAYDLQLILQTLKAVVS